MILKGENEGQGTIFFSTSVSSVTQSCLTFCDSMDCNTPGFPIQHQLPELAQTLVHRGGDAIQPSYSPLALQDIILRELSAVCLSYSPFSLLPSSQLASLSAFLDES